MAIKLIAEQEIRVGEPTFIDAASPSMPFAVIFEDNGETGYFYALDKTRTDNPIVDALHIYNVVSVTDKHLSSKIELVWSSDDKKAALLINRYPHAIFDFEAKRGYCRTGFPPPSKGGWTDFSHKWDDKAEELFR